MSFRLGAWFAIACSLLIAPAAHGQETLWNDWSTSLRYDGIGRLVGEISPDPDGTGPLHFPAKRTVYDQSGLVIRVETGELLNWQPTSVDPNNWPSFTILTTEKYGYDTMGRVVRTEVVGSDNVTVSLVHTNYDHDGRPGCVAIRMDATKFSTAPINACSLTSGAVGADGPDRIQKTIYDSLGQVRQVRKALGTTDEIADVTYDYTGNGKVKFVVDANGNKAELKYDGHDRQVGWVFPAEAGPGTGVFDDDTYTTALNTAGAPNPNDYESYTYDKVGNRLTLRKRDNTTITYYYNALNQLTRKDIPNRTGLHVSHSRDVYYKYDLRGLQTSARFGTGASDPGIINTYTGFGDLKSTQSTLIPGTLPLQSQYDPNGNRTTLTHPDGQAFTMTYDRLDRLKEVKKGSTVLVAPLFNNRGSVSSISRAASAHAQTFGYDAIGRLATLGLSASGSSSNVQWSFTRNPASQIRTGARDNDSYAWRFSENANRSYVSNGLNQYTSSQNGGVTESFCYDDNGNLTADSTSVYLYDVENRLVERRDRVLSTCPNFSSGYTGSLKATLRYDPLGRLYEVVDGSNGNITRFLNDGDALTLEYANGGAILRRYLHGSNGGADDPLIWYEGSGTASTDLRNLYADPRGTIVLVGGQGGNTIGINTYDEWGINRIDNEGRFQFTGQAWIDELEMYYYKARIYSPTLGRFMQTDPIGYDDQFNLYAYVNNDPVNHTDPTGSETGTFANGCMGDSCMNIDPGGQTHRAATGVLLTVAATLAPEVLGSEIVVTAAVARGAGFFERVGSFFGRLFGGARRAEEAVKVGSAIERGALSETQAANLARFEGKLPANAGETTITAGKNGSVTMSATSPGRVPGSSATYTKTMDASGKTTGYTKATTVPSGEIVHVKDKFNQ